MHKAIKVLYLEGRVRAWGLPNELLGNSALSALSFQATDHANPMTPRGARDED